MTSASWLSGSASSASRQMLSASPGSLSSRYRSAFARALGTASSDSVFSSKVMAILNSSGFRSRLSTPKSSKQFDDRVVQFIDHPLLERDDGIVGDGNPLGADFGARSEE